MVKRMLLVALAVAGTAQAAPLALGVMVGEPTGLSAKYWLDKLHAVDAGLAWSLSDDPDLHLHADYLIHKLGLSVDGLSGGLAFHYGLGGRLQLRDDSGDKHDDEDRLGLRLPLGLDWTPTRDLELFLEVAPVVDLLPDTHARLSGGLGVRFRLR